MHRETPDQRNWNDNDRKEIPFLFLNTEVKSQVLFIQQFQISFNGVTLKLKWGKTKRHLHAQSVPIRTTWLICMINKSLLIQLNYLWPCLVVSVWTPCQEPQWYCYSTMISRAWGLVRLPGFKSQLYYFAALWLETNSLTSLNLSFFYKWEIE